MASLVQRPGSSTYYIQFYLSGKLKRKSTGTESFQIAKEKLRQFESAQVRGDASPFPTRTPITDVLIQSLLAASAHAVDQGLNVIVLPDHLKPPSRVAVLRRPTK